MWGPSLTGLTGNDRSTADIMVYSTHCMCVSILILMFGYTDDMSTYDIYCCDNKHKLCLSTHLSRDNGLNRSGSVNVIYIITTNNKQLIPDCLFRLGRKCTGFGVLSLPGDFETF